MIYLVKKTTWNMICKSDNLRNVKKYLTDHNLNEQDYFILKDLNMNYISRITYVDDVCIYNNKDFWLGDLKEILENYSSHTVKDFLGETISLERFKIEMNNNITRLNAIDGLAGQIDYNQEIGQEFVDVFREECVKTDFKTITPLEIGEKLSSVIVLLGTGSFRESVLLLKQIQANNTDTFLTVARLQKYIDMLNAADVINYATDVGYYYNEDGTKIEE